MNAVVFTAVALMCIINYALAIFTDPGRVPSTYMPDIEDSENPIHEIKRKVPNAWCFLLIAFAFIFFFVLFGN